MMKNQLFYKGTKRQRLLLVLLLIVSTCSGLLAQNQTVRGKVTSAIAADSALAGVSIQVKGTKTGTVTDNNGNFSINVPGNGVLVFSAVGYTMQEVSISNRNTINIQLA